MASGRRRWQTSKLPPLVGAKEVCALLAIQKTTLSRWRRGREPYFDIPPAKPGPSQGPVWVRADVIAWGKQNGRLRAAAGSAD